MSDDLVRLCAGTGVEVAQRGGLRHRRAHAPTTPRRSGSRDARPGQSCDWPTAEHLTDAEGHYHLTAQHGLGLLNIGPGVPLEQQVPVVISKDGYKPFKTIAHFDDASTTVDAALVPE